MCDTIQSRRAKSRVADCWLSVFLEDPERALWPEVRSMARELIEARRRLAIIDAMRIYSAEA
jgi:hypothetical protein